jgi:hypothetical protein
MLKPSSKNVAEAFIKDQFAIMKKYGTAPKLSAKAYKTLLAKTSRSFAALKPTSPRTLQAKNGQ